MYWNTFYEKNEQGLNACVWTCGVVGEECWTCLHVVAEGALIQALCRKHLIATLYIFSFSQATIYVSLSYQPPSDDQGTLEHPERHREEGTDGATLLKQHKDGLPSRWVASTGYLSSCSVCINYLCIYRLPTCVYCNWLMDIFARAPILCNAFNTW